MPKFKVVNVDNKITRAIGKKQNLLGLSDNKDTVIFLKNRFDYNNNEKNILSRLNTQLDIGKEIQKFRDDLFISLTNINSLQGLNSQLPTIDDKVLSGLADLNVSLKNDKRSNFYLDKISETQKKIYKILSKIQEDLVDEQDTKIKEEKKRDTEENEGYQAKAKNLPKAKENLTPSGYGIDPSLLAKAAKALSTAGSALIRIAGKVFKLAEIILLLYYIVHNWYVAEESIDSPGVLEKLIFALFAGVTEWVGTHLELMSWIVDNYLELCNWIKDNITQYSEYLGEYQNLVGYLVTALEYSPLKLLCEKCLKPVFDWLKENGEYGVPVGVYAVQYYRSIKDSFTNAIPNGTTYELLFGENKPLERLTDSGVYVWNKLGKSSIKGSARDLAKNLTKEELENVKLHADIDEYDLKKINEALSIKESEGIADEQIEERRKLNIGIDSLVRDLSKNISFIDDDWKKLWVALAQTSKDFILESPESTVITFFTRNGIPSTLNQNHLLYENSSLIGLDKTTDAPEVLCDGIVKNLKIHFNSEKEIFWFTPYGSVIIQYTVTDPIKSKQLIDRSLVKNPKLVKGYLLNVYKVFGYYTPNFTFVKDFFNPNDIVFKKIFKYNIITNSNVDYAIKINKTDFKGVSDTTDKNSYASSVKSLPSYVPQISVEADESYDTTAKTTPTDIKRRVWDFFKNEMNLKDFQIAGIMGNLEAETNFLAKNIQGEHFDRSASGKNDGMSGGLCQWHDVNGKGRLSKLKEFARKHGGDWKDLDIQLLFLKHELQTTHKKALSEIMKSTNVREATRAWVYHFEKPADMEGEALKRTRKSQKYLNTFSTDSSGISIDEARSFEQSKLDEARGKVENIPQGGSEVESPSADKILVDARNMIKGTVYSQGQRGRKGFYDCSSFVTAVLKKQGYKIDGIPTTHRYDRILTGIGFKKVGGTTANEKKGLQPGDILLKKGKHIMIYNGKGSVIEANGYGNRNHNGINMWDGSLHSRSDVYEIWRAGNDLSVKQSESFKPSNEVVNTPKEVAQSDVKSGTQTNSSTVNVNMQTAKEEYEYSGMSEELFKFKLDTLA